MQKLRNNGRLQVLAAVMVLAVVMVLVVSQTAALAAPQANGTTDTAQDNCTYTWFFGSVAHPVAACPAAPAAANMFARLEFERGEMVWNAAENTVYVLYRDFQAPYWEAFPDTYLQGMAERDPSIIGPLGTWQQPRRGFGELWRNNPTVRARLGWALNEWEQSYIGYVQRASTPNGDVIYFTRDDQKAYELLPGAGGIWQLFSFLG